MYEEFRTLNAKIACLLINVHKYSFMYQNNAQFFPYMFEKIWFQNTDVYLRNSVFVFNYISDYDKYKSDDNVSMYVYSVCICLRHERCVREIEKTVTYISFESFLNRFV